MQISKEVHKFLIAALFALGIIQFEEREPVRRPSYIQYLFLGRRKKSLKVFSLNPFTISLIVRIILMELSECLSPGVIIGHLFCLFFPPPLIPSFQLVILLSKPNLCLGDFLTAFY